MARKGVQSFFDANDEPRAVLIDVRKNPELWKTFRTMMLTDENDREQHGVKNGKAASKKQRPNHGTAQSAAIAAFFEPGEKIRTMNGVELLFDKHGKPKAVWIDLCKNPELWEDFDDLLVCEERRNEPTVPFEAVQKRLRKLGKLR